MRSNKDIVEFMKRTGKEPKAYLEQRLSVDDDAQIHYYKYTLLTADQKISKDDISDLVIIPDDRDIIVGDFDSADTKARFVNVVSAIQKDMGMEHTTLPMLKTPIWDYADSIDVLVTKPKSRLEMYTDQLTASTVELASFNNTPKSSPTGHGCINPHVSQSPVRMVGESEMRMHQAVAPTPTSTPVPLWKRIIRRVRDFLNNIFF